MKNTGAAETMDGPRESGGTSTGCRRPRGGGRCGHGRQHWPPTPTACMACHRGRSRRGREEGRGHQGPATAGASAVALRPSPRRCFRREEERVGKGEKWRGGRERKRDAREEWRQERGEGPLVHRRPARRRLRKVRARGWGEMCVRFFLFLC